MSSPFKKFDSKSVFSKGLISSDNDFIKLLRVPLKAFLLYRKVSILSADFWNSPQTNSRKISPQYKDFSDFEKSNNCSQILVQFYLGFFMDFAWILLENSKICIGWKNQCPNILIFSSFRWDMAPSVRPLWCAHWKINRRLHWILTLSLSRARNWVSFGKLLNTAMETLQLTWLKYASILV